MLYFPLSLSQQDIYFDQLRYPKSPVYNIGGYMTLAAVDVPRLQQAHAQLVQHFKCFGVRIRETEQGVEQWISEQRDDTLPIQDFSIAADPHGAADTWLAERFSYAFELHEEALFHSWLVKLSDGEYRYVGLAHHLMMDGWGFANWTYELCQFYHHAEPRGNDKWLDLIPKEQQYLKSERYQRDAAFWLQQCQMPEQNTASNRVLTPFYQGQYPLGQVPSGRCRQRFSHSEYRQLQQCLQENQLGAVPFLLSCTSACFAALYQQDSFVVGMPTHNRKSYAERVSLGLSVGVNPLRVEVSVEQHVLDFAQQLTQQLRRAYRHQAFPLGHVIAQLPELTEKSELYEFGFNYLKMDSQLDFDGHPSQLVYLHNQHETTPLLLTVWEYGDGGELEFQLDYSKAYFTDTEAKLMLERMHHSVVQLLAQPQQPLSEVNYLPWQEQTQLRDLACGARIPTAAEASLLERFEQQVALVPQKTAVVAAGESLTYAELHYQARVWAIHLKHQGVGPEQAVGISLQRHCDMLVAVLAVLYTGATYVPLDASYPQERLNYIVADSQISVLLTEEALRHRYQLEQQEPAVAVLTRESMPKSADINGFKPSYDPEAIAYVIYTSGSTGQPKGVEIRHRNAVAMVHWALEVYSESQLQGVLASTSLNFDLSIFELFVPLSAGGCCILVDNALALTEPGADTWNQQLTLINTVPSAMKTLLQMQAVPASVQVVNLAGEALGKTLVNDLFQQTRVKQVYNLYGPSEDTTYSTYACYDAPLNQAPSIGRPIANSQAQVRDANGQLCGIGVPGELYLSGDGVARGYRGQPLLTEARFREIDGQLSYRTGDLVRWEETGNLQFLGRLDHQVKVRGFRIELGEIEGQLNQIDGIREAIVRFDEENERLVAYWVADDEAAASTLDSQAIQQQLSQHLPTYMVPSINVLLAALPLTPNGKIDRKALPDIDAKSHNSFEGRGHSSTEVALLALWQSVLKRNDLSPMSDFFASGGHSLLAIKLIPVIAAQFSVAIRLGDLFQHSQLQQLAAWIEQQPQHQSEPDIALVDSLSAPLTGQQQGIWLQEQMQGPSARYNMTLPLQLQGALNLSALEQALNDLRHRHPILSTGLQQKDGRVTQLQKCHDRVALTPVLVPDSADLDEQALTALALKRVEQEMATPIALDTDALMRVSLLVLAPDKHLLLLTLHHIICDGWSLDILARDLSHAYRHRLGNLGQNSAPLVASTETLQYKDYAHSPASRPVVTDADRAFWQEQLKDFPKIHNLPLSQARPAVQSAVGCSEVRYLSNTLVEALQTRALQWQITPAAILNACYLLLLSRWSNSESIMVGIPNAGRHLAQTHDMIGCFVQLQVLHGNIPKQEAFAQWAVQVHQQQQAILQHSHVPFSDLVEQHLTERSAQYSPLAQILFNYLQTQDRQLDFAGVDVTVLSPQHSNLRFDLELHVEYDGQQMQLRWLFADAIFDPAMMQRLFVSFEVLLEAALSQPEKALAALPLVNSPIPDVDCSNPMPVTSLYQAIAQQAELTPNAVAIRASDQDLSYQQVLQRSNDIALYLRGQGVKSGDLVGVCLSRQSHLLPALLGILQLGAAYVPLDPEYPQQRLNYILDNSGAAHIVTSDPEGLTSDAQLHNIADIPVLPEVAASAYWHTPIDPEQLAYVIYTSGSTGQPKGVEIRHRNVLALLHWSQHFYTPEQLSGVLVSTSLNFDLSVFELFATLTQGGCCYLVDNALTLLEKPLPITLINTVPSAMQVLLDNKAVPDTVCAVNLAGEPLGERLVNGIFAHSQAKVVHNLYGPSEDTTYSTVASFTGPIADAPTIGRPISQTLALVLSPDGQRQPDGAPGELYLAGAGVSKQYRGRPDLTEERYVQLPFAPAHTFYKTGDLVRINSHGQLQYMGRSDHQVKLRGFRIELGEIETQLALIAGIKTAAVTLVHRQNTQYLLAHAVLEPGHSEIGEQGVLLQLQAKLPDYMIPANVVFLPEMPLTPNGKVDRLALQNQVPSRLAETKGRGAETPLERQLLALWQQALGQEVIAMEDNFFQLGGHSLLIASMIHQAAQQFQLHLEPVWLYQQQTIAGLAAYIADVQSTEMPNGVEARDDSASPASLAIPPRQISTVAPLASGQYRLWFLQQLNGPQAEDNIVGGLRLQGPVSVARLRDCLEQLAQRHAILRAEIVAPKLTDSQPSVSDQPLAERLYPQQQLQTDFQLPLQYQDLTQAADLEAALAAAITTHSQRCFALDGHELWSALWLATSEETGVLHLNFHHILLDGWSLSLFVNELMCLLAQKTLPPMVGPDYFDYATWQQQQMADQEAPDWHASNGFWRDYLADCQQGLVLPLDSPASEDTSQHTQGDEVSVLLPATMGKALSALAQQQQASLFNILYSGFAVLIHKLTGAADFNIGIPVAGRMQADWQQTMGNFLNNLPLRNRMAPEQDFWQLLRQQIQDSHQVLAHQALPFESILALLDIPHSAEQTPLFQVFFNMLNLPEVHLQQGDIAAEVMLEQQQASKFDLTLYAQPLADGGIQLRFNYACQQYSHTAVSILAQQYQYLLQQILQKADDTHNPLPLQHLSLVGPEAQYCRLPKPQQGLPELWLGSICDKIVVQAAKQPERVALSYKGQEWSYVQLDNITGALARRLLVFGAGNGRPVAIVTERSDALVLATLAVLKSGSPFVMLSADWPTQRLQAILDIAQPAVVMGFNEHAQGAIAACSLGDACQYLAISRQHWQDYCAQRPLGQLPLVQANTPAYIAFTSGTEGNPKGVQGSHRALSDFVDWMARNFELSGADRFGMLSGLVHDPLHRDILTPLAIGATLVVPTQETFEYGRMGTWLAENQISVLHLTPSLGNLIAVTSDVQLPELRRAFFVGEKLTRSHVMDFRRFAPNLTLINLYGSTETSRAVGYCKVPADAQDLPDVIPAGRGIVATQLLVLNSDLKLCGVGEVGQIAVRSRGIALGYLNAPELNAAKFIRFQDESGQQIPIYLTGDLGHYNTTGDVICLGRLDRQVKIRGFRVELAEIEVACNRIAGVSQTAVLAEGETDPQLHVFVCPEPDAELAIDVIQQQLLEQLPDYMQPSHIQLLPHIPQTQNGKVDTQALKLLQVKVDTEVEVVPPETDVEQQLHALYCEILQRPQCSVTARFFDLGGNSLLMTKLLTRLQSQFQLTLSYQGFFSQSSIRHVAVQLDREKIKQQVLSGPSNSGNKKKVKL